MVLTGERVLLRDFDLADLPAYTRIHADPRFAEFRGPDESTPDHAARLVELFSSWAEEVPRRDFQLAIADRTSGDLLGSCGVRTGEHPAGCAEFGIELAAPSWGRGLASEAARLVLAFGFESLRLAEVQAESVTQNARIARLLRRLGFHELGFRRQAGWMDERGWTRTDWILPRDAWLSGAACA
jgi:RimJ/RimL family protein N-acetyltransferase